MKTINRDKIQRMVGDRYGGGGSRGESADLDGYASQIWVNQNFVSKKFFARLFTINGTDENDDDVVVEPNDLDTDITDIQLMFGAWTEKFMSALGMNDAAGGGGGGASYLSQLLDVLISGATSGQALVFNGQKWVNQSIQTSGGTVISVAMRVPTGLKVSGGASQTITQSGTFNITFDEGYSIPTNEKQTAWDNVSNNFDNNGNAKSALKLTTVSKTAWGQTYWTANGIPDNISGNMTSVGDITFTNGNRKLQFDSNDDFHIRKISDRFIIKANGTAVINIYNNQFYCATQIHTTVGLLSDDYVSALSDIRYKNVLKNFSLSIDDIAGASLILFTWKDRDDDRHHAGIIAQEWQKILPEAVVEGEDGKLAVDYGVIGAASAISLARKVKEQQKEIDIQKKKNEELEKRLARLEKMFAVTDED